MAWGAIAAAAIGAAASLWSSHQQASAQQDAAASALAANEYNYRHRWQWEVADARAAGLNPISLFGGGAHSPGMVAPAPVAEVPNKTAAFTQFTAQMAQMWAIQKEQLDLQKASNAAEIKLKESEARLADKKADNEIANNPLIVAQTALKRFELDNMMPVLLSLREAEREKMFREMEKIRAETGHLNALTQLEKMQALVEKYRGEVDYLKLDYLKKNPHLLSYEVGAGRSMQGLPAFGQEGLDLFGGAKKWTSDKAKEFGDWSYEKIREMAIRFNKAMDDIAKKTGRKK